MTPKKQAPSHKPIKLFNLDKHIILSKLNNFINVNDRDAENMDHIYDIAL